MLGWLFPRSPIAPVEKAWVEKSMLWLAQQFTLQPMLTAPATLPDQELLFDDYQPDLEHAQQLLGMLSHHLQGKQDKVALEITGQTCGSHTVLSSHTGGQPTESNSVSALEIGDQHANQSVIRISQDRLTYPHLVAADITRGLAAQQINSVSHASPPSPAPWLTDLATVYFGWGVVIAHTETGDDSGEGSCGSCSGQSTQNSAPLRLVGYALALYAQLRGESPALWRRHLRPDAAVVCERSWTYLRRTNDSLFTRDTATQRPTEQGGADQLLLQLKTGSASARVAALWDLRSAAHADAAADAVTDCLHDRLPAIREEAAKTVTHFGMVAHDAAPALIDLLHDGNSAIRTAAATALSQVAAEDDETINHLAPLLGDSARNVVLAASEAIGRFGGRTNETVPAVLKALRGALVRCDHPLIDSLTRTLYAIDTDPTDRVMEFFEDDVDLRQQAIHVMVDALDTSDDSDLA